MQALSRHELLLEGRRIPYVLKRSPRRRRICLLIDENGLRVGAPWRASQRRIEAVLLEHAPWINRKLAEWQAQRPAPVAWHCGTRLMLLGEAWTLTCDPTRATVAQAPGAVTLPIDPAAGPVAIQSLAVQWLREEALRCFGERVAYFAPALEVALPRIRLSNAKTRWGTCHPDGRIRLNWRLIQMPLALLDYVVVHELAHLLQPNHSHRFWLEVERVLPDYAQRRRALRREGYRYLVA